MMRQTATHNWGNLPGLDAKYVELGIQVFKQFKSK